MTNTEINPLAPSSQEITWNHQKINLRLAGVEQNLPPVIEGTPRFISGQCITVKTVNAPHLLERFLDHATKTIALTQADGEIALGVVDDSLESETRYQNRRIVEKIMKTTGQHIEILASHDQSSTSLIGKLRNVLLNKPKNQDLSRIDKAKLLIDMQMLFTERFNIRYPDRNPSDFSDEYIASRYSSLGGGANATTNLALILNAYLMGKYDIPVSNAVCTINEDDVIYGTLEIDDNQPQLSAHDFFRERELLFSDPLTSFVAGKYVGMSGNQAQILKNALEITTGILLNNEKYNSPEAPSPYYFYNVTTGKFEKMSIQEAYYKLPEIINHYLARIPVSSFKLPGPKPDLWIFDQGNFSMIGSLAEKSPFPVTGIAEFIMTGMLKSQQKVQNPRFMTLETPILHLRSERFNKMDVYQGKLVTGMTTAPLRVDQYRLETALRLKGKELSAGFQDGLEDTQITAEIFNGNMPQLAAVRGNTVEVFKSLREVISMYLNQLKKGDQFDHPLIISLERLLAEVSDESLEKVDLNIDDHDISKTVKYTLRFIKASKLWPVLFTLAWEIGLKEKHESI